ncbi:MAG: hypothetical protein AB7G37_18070 [Solirubrobacteraceae bacterium]
MPVDGAFVRHLDLTGAVCTSRSGRRVVAHFGSPGGELAACLTRAGLTVRADLAAFSLTADASRLELLARRMTALDLRPGGVSFVGGTTAWCRTADGSALRVVLPAARAASGRSALTSEAVHRVGGVLGPPLAVLQLVGPTASAVLADLGAFGPSRDPSRGAPHVDLVLAGRPAFVVAESMSSFLVVVEDDAAVDAWRAIGDAGRRHGLCPVGVEAVRRSAVHARQRERLSGPFTVPDGGS